VEHRSQQWDLVLVDNEGKLVVMDLVGDPLPGVESPLMTISLEVEDDDDRDRLIWTAARWQVENHPVELDAVRDGDTVVVTLTAGGDELRLTTAA
jgi:hypothetical protein